MKKRFLVVALMLCLLLSASSCGKTAAPDTLHARFEVLYLADFPQAYLDAPQENAERIAGFGLESFADTFKNPSAFKCYNVEVTVQNETDAPVNLLALSVNAKLNGKNGVYFNAYGDDTTYGMPAHFSGKQTMYYQVLADASLSMDEVLQILGEMDIRGIYVNAATGAESLEEAKAEDRMECAVLYAQ